MFRPSAVARAQRSLAVCGRRRGYASVARATGSGVTAGSRRTSLFRSSSAKPAAMRTTVHTPSPLSILALRPAPVVSAAASAAASAPSSSAGADAPLGPPVLRVKVNQMNSFTWAWQTMLELLVVFAFLHSIVIPIITFAIEKPIELMLALMSSPEESE